MHCTFDFCPQTSQLKDSNVTNVLIHTLDFQVAKVCSTYELEYVYVCTFKMYGLFSLECGCNLQGTEKGDPTCNNDDGKCNCKCDVDGDKCATCSKGYYSFPQCLGKRKIEINIILGSKVSVFQSVNVLKKVQLIANVT